MQKASNRPKLKFICWQIIKTTNEYKKKKNSLVIYRQNTSNAFYWKLPKKTPFVCIGAVALADDSICISNLAKMFWNGFGAKNGSCTAF